MTKEDENEDENGQDEGKHDGAKSEDEKDDAEDDEVDDEGAEDDEDENMDEAKSIRINMAALGNDVRWAMTCGEQCASSSSRYVKSFSEPQR